MANPNIVNVTEIYGNTSVTLATTTQANIVANAANSGKIYKINALYVANMHGTNAADVNVNFMNASNAAFSIASTISVAADSTTVLITKDSSIYLTEGTYIQANANVVSSLHLTCSWDEIK